MNALNSTDEGTQGVKDKCEAIIAELQNLGAFVFRLETPKGERVAIAHKTSDGFRADVL